MRTMVCFCQGRIQSLTLEAGGGALLSFSCEKFLNTIVCYRKPIGSASGRCFVSMAIDQRLSHLAGCFVSASVAFVRFSAS